MPVEQCYWGICFIPLNADGPDIFGFGEFLGALALMILAWTIGDVRYKFRINVAPLPLKRVTFSTIVIIGILTLLTDLWLAQQWLVPHGNFITPAIWQALLGALFLLNFVIWTLFAFIYPPIFGPKNARRYAQTLYRAILKGSPTELAVIADELALSATSLVKFAPDWKQLPYQPRPGNKPPLEKMSTATAYANDILLLIADKKFCSAVIASSPGTILALFSEVNETKKYNIAIGTFGKNIMAEAMENENSFLFHEVEAYESGLIGHLKPISQSMFSNHRMVAQLETLFDTNYQKRDKWSGAQWEAYCRVVLICYEDYTSTELGQHSYVLYGAISKIEQAASDLYKTNGISTGYWDEDLHGRLTATVGFVRSAVEIIDGKDFARYVTLRVHEKGFNSETILDRLARMIFKVIQFASTVQTPLDHCWSTQRNQVWSDLYQSHELNGAAGKIVRFKVRRLIFDEILRMGRSPNFKGSKILGFCLNVMGLSESTMDWDENCKALHKAVLSWTKRNYIWLHNQNPRVAENCLVAGMSFDQKDSRLVLTYPAEGLRLAPEYRYLKLDSLEIREKNEKSNAIKV